MVFLLLSILSSLFITLIFKLITRRKIHLFSSIIVNYFTACLLGFAFANYSGGFFLTAKLLLAAVIVGIFFIITFRLIGLSNHIAGMGVTSIACRMSLVIPLFVTFYFDPSDVLTLPKVAGSVMALIALVLVTYKKESRAADINVMVLPIVLFFLTGVTDSSVKMAQLTVVSKDIDSNFTALVFGIAGTIGLITLLARREHRQLADAGCWKYGALLGVANYGSLLFFIKALNSSIPSSIIFSINNIAIVALSVIIGITLYKEKMSILNTVGVAVAIISLVYLTSI